MPPAIAISELAKAAPPFVTLVPCTMMVAPLRTPASSSVMSFTACWPAGVCEPRSTDARLWSVTPLARSTTSGGKIFIAQTDDPLRELPAERCHGAAPRGHARHHSNPKRSAASATPPPVVTSARRCSVAAAFTSSMACAIANERPATRSMETSFSQSPTATTSLTSIP